MVNAAKLKSTNDGHEYLRDVFYDIEDQMKYSLLRERKRETHDGTLGGNCEQVWRELLRKYLPTRYQIEEAFIIDSLGNTSEQQDIVIFDAIYTSPLHGHEHKKYLPRESVYAVFEVKQTVDKENLIYAGHKASTVNDLHCTSADIVNAGHSFPGRAVFRPLTGLLANSANWSKGLESDSFKQNLPKPENERLDFVITAESGFFAAKQSPDNELFSGRGALMRGIFRLLQSLQEIGTVPAIDWKIYEDILANE